MRQRFTAEAGASLRAISLQTGPAYGIEIDNASGSWLYIPTLETWVSPYTLGWAQAFPYGVASVDIIAGNGPSGQIGTSQGDPITVYLSDQPVAASAGQIDPGAAFVQGFTPISTSSAQVVVPAVSGPIIQFAILPAVAGKRYRIWTATVTLGLGAGFPFINYDSGVLFFFSGSGFSPIVGRVNRDRPVDFRPYPQGLDFPSGSAIDFQASADFADAIIQRNLTYSLL